MSLAIIGIDAICEGVEQSIPEQDTALECGYIDEGNASGPVGSGWYDTSKGPDYGHGARYECEETRFMTRVPSKNK